MKRLLFLLPAGAFAVLVVYFAVGLRHDPHIVPSVLIDKPVPTFSLPPIEGTDKKGFGSADLSGGISVVNVFASWCVPCRLEHPLIQALAEREVATVYGLNYKDEPAAARRWLAELGDPYAAIGADFSGRVGIEWGVYGVPETFIVDAGGRIRHKHIGPITAEALRDEIIPVIERLRQ